jgi:hydrogenase-4 membrane subunit HyfE
MIIIQTLLVPIFLIGNLRSRAKKVGERDGKYLHMGWGRARDMRTYGFILSKLAFTNWVIPILVAIPLLNLILSSMVTSNNMKEGIRRKVINKGMPKIKMNITLSTGYPLRNSE